MRMPGASRWTPRALAAMVAVNDYFKPRAAAGAHDRRLPRRARGPGRLADVAGAAARSGRAGCGPGTPSRSCRPRGAGRPSSRTCSTAGWRCCAAWGLVVREYPSTRAGVTMPARARRGRRAADLNAAFADPGVAAIIASIGGDDAIRLLPYLDARRHRREPQDPDGLLRHDRAAGRGAADGPRHLPRTVGDGGAVAARRRCRPWQGSTSGGCCSSRRTGWSTRRSAC